MKRNVTIFTAILGLLLLTLSTSAHPTDPFAVQVTSLNGKVPISAATDVDVEYILVIWLTSGGHYEYTVDVTSLTFSGTTCNQLNTIPLSSIMEDVADHAVELAVSAGYPECGLAYYQVPTKVWVNSCAIRSGSGCGTAFLTCYPDVWAYRGYTITCPGNGIPSITQTYTGTSDCSECGEGACPAGEEEFE